MVLASKDGHPHAWPEPSEEPLELPAQYTLIEDHPIVFGTSGLAARRYPESLRALINAEAESGVKPQDSLRVAMGLAFLQGRCDSIKGVQTLPPQWRFVLYEGRPGLFGNLQCMFLCSEDPFEGRGTPLHEEPLLLPANDFGTAQNHAIDLAVIRHQERRLEGFYYIRHFLAASFLVGRHQRILEENSAKAKNDRETQSLTA